MCWPTYLDPASGRSQAYARPLWSTRKCHSSKNCWTIKPTVTSSTCVAYLQLDPGFHHNQYHIYGTLKWSIGIQIHVLSLYIYIALFPWRGTRRLAFWASERFFDTNSQPQAAWWLWSAQLPVSCGYGCLWRKKVWGNNREHDLYPEIKGLIFSSQPVWADKITVIFHWVTVDHWSCEPPTMGETGSWSIGPISEFIRFNTFNYGK